MHLFLLSLFSLSLIIAENFNNLPYISGETDFSQYMEHNNEEYISDDIDDVYDEDEESDDEYDSIKKPAFYVEGDPDFDSGPPQDGLEYLRRVRYFFILACLIKNNKTQRKRSYKSGVQCKKKILRF